MELILIVLIYLFGNINSFMFGIQKYQREYCFFKYINSTNQRISYNFQTVGEKQERIDTILRQITPNKKDIYSTSNTERGEFITNILNPGKYNLCFYPYSSNTFSVTFNFQTSEEEGDYKNVATDTSLKKVREKIDEIEKGMNNIYFDSNTLLTRRLFNFIYLNNYISQIKLLTFVKIGIVGLISLFQIYVIQKMFGEDKRMSKIKPTTSKNNNKIEFL